MLGGPARPGGNFGGNPANLGAAPHDWGFAKKSYCTRGHLLTFPLLRSKFVSDLVSIFDTG